MLKKYFSRLLIFLYSITLFSCSTMQSVLINTLDIQSKDSSYFVNTEWYATNNYLKVPFSPNINSNKTEWFEKNYKMYDNEWNILNKKFDSDWKCENCDRFYRGIFYISSIEDMFHDIVLGFKSDDGIWIYINGKFIAHYGGRIHEQGCVNMGNCGIESTVEPFKINKYLTTGTNIIAIQVSQSINNQYFEANLYAQSTTKNGLKNQRFNYKK